MGAVGDITYNHNAKVSFPLVMTNVGGGYDPNTSKYTCPVTGEYLFSAAVMSKLGYVAHPRIVIDGHNKVSVWSDGRGGSHGQGTVVIVVKCNQRQQVWVNASGDLYDSESNFSIFTGVLINQM